MQSQNSTRTRHKRTNSLQTLRLGPKICTDFPRSQPSPTVTSHSDESTGAFTPTLSAFPSLLHLAENSDYCTFPRDRRRRFQSCRDAFPASSAAAAAATAVTVSAAPSTLGRPRSIAPTISRTSSPLSAAAAADAGSQPPYQACSINPILAELERKSKLCATSMVCASCHTQGQQFPRCPKCQFFFCSRRCRLETKHHSCAAKKAG